MCPAVAEPSPAQFAAAARATEVAIAAGSAPPSSGVDASATDAERGRLAGIIVGSVLGFFLLCGICVYAFTRNSGPGRRSSAGGPPAGNAARAASKQAAGGEADEGDAHEQRLLRGAELVPAAARPRPTANERNVFAIDSPPPAPMSPLAAAAAAPSSVAAAARTHRGTAAAAAQDLRGGPFGAPRHALGSVFGAAQPQQQGSGRDAPPQQQQQRTAAPTAAKNAALDGIDIAVDDVGLSRGDGDDGLGIFGAATSARDVEMSERNAAAPRRPRQPHAGSSPNPGAIDIGDLADILAGVSVTPVRQTGGGGGTAATATARASDAARPSNPFSRGSTAAVTLSLSPIAQAVNDSRFDDAFDAFLL